MTTKTTYDPRIKPEFVMACAKVARVEVCSSQVVLSARDSIDMCRIDIPPVYEVQWVGKVEGGVQVTLRLRDERP